MSKFVDPNLRKLVEQRILYSLKHKGKFDQNCSMPTRYVVHGQPQSNVTEAVQTLLSDFRTVDLQDDDPLAYSDHVLILTNGHLYLTKHLVKLKDSKQIFVIVNNTPPTKLPWADYTDYQLTYGTPPMHFFVELFGELFTQFADEHDIELDIDYESIAEHSMNCTEQDARDFCTAIFRDAVFNTTKKLDMDVVKSYFIADKIQESVSSITSRNTSLAQDEYKVVEPANKKLRLR